MFVAYHKANCASGYDSIAYMAELAIELFEADLVVATQPHTRGELYWELIRSVLGRRNGGRDSGLLVCRMPSDLKLVLDVPDWRSRFGRTAAWIIDSFVPEAIPRSIRLLRCFDHIFVACQRDVEETWRKTGVPTSWLPVGSDVLRLGSASEERPYDVLRVGRQPPTWDDDAINEEACRRRGLRFHGRPPHYIDPVENHTRLTEFCASAKYCMAFSNLVAPAAYTHPTRDYLTPRWLDAISSGATVAGVRPGAEEAQQLLWPEATLELDTVDREEGLDLIAQAVQSWTPALAQKNRAMALRRLDWRWRFLEVARVLDQTAPTLQAELDQLNQAIAEPSLVESDEPSFN